MYYSNNGSWAAHAILTTVIIVDWTEQAVQGVCGSKAGISCVSPEMDINGNGHALSLSASDCLDADRQYIGIDGYWYDITTFIPHHPGGDIIKQFVGKDASVVFHAFHKQSVLKHRKPRAKMEEIKAEVDEAGIAFAQLGQYFEKEGYFNIDYYWYARKFLVAFILLTICVTIVVNYNASPYVYIGSVVLAAFWQQCGFFMHDFEHNQFTHNRKIDTWLGTFFGTFCFGVSGSWWRKEHFIHHALTTCVDHSQKFADPQMMQPIIWVQNQKLWPFYQSRLAFMCVKIQHITFLPICVFAGRFAIMRESLLQMLQERNPRELVALALHWVWLSLLLSFLPTYTHIAKFYALAAICQGVLHIQLLISHYAKTFHEVKDINTNIHWSRMQVESNIDIITPWWLDWFHGGLNFHLVHHLYPRMPRHNFRKATAIVKKLCDQNNLTYDHCGWFDAVKRTLSQLKLMSHHFSLDPR